jgi:hypothetical protein
MFQKSKLHFNFIWLIGIVCTFLCYGGYTKAVFAAPVINSTSGNLTHPGTITITGSGFGTKTTAVPVMWDDGETATVNRPSEVLSRGWNEALPYSPDDPNAILQYRSVPYRNMVAPHGHSSKYLVGGHALNNGCTDSYHRGGNVAVSVSIPTTTESVYASWYERVDDLWPNNDASVWDNYKYGDIGYNGTYDPPHVYVNDTNTLTPQYKLGYEGARAYPYGTESICGWEEYPANYNTNMRHTSVFGNWVKKEMVFYHGKTSDGWWKTYANNKVIWEPCTLNTGTPTNTKCAWWSSTVCANYDCVKHPEYKNIGGVTIGGYWRDSICPGTETMANGNANAFRYMDDIYIDNTLSRVVLANNQTYENATIVEPQIPSAWNNASITVTVNLGNFISGTAYVFVFDANNNHNAIGYPVVIGESGGVTVPARPVLSP